MLFFQPDGTISASQDGAPFDRYVLQIMDTTTEQRTIVLQGSTGYVN